MVQSSALVPLQRYRTTSIALSHVISIIAFCGASLYSGPCNSILTPLISSSDVDDWITVVFASIEWDGKVPATGIICETTFSSPRTAYLMKHTAKLSNYRKRGYLEFRHHICLEMDISYYPIQGLDINQEILLNSLLLEVYRRFSRLYGDLSEDSGRNGMVGYWRNNQKTLMQMVEGGVTVAAEEETESSSQQQVRQFDDDDARNRRWSQNSKYWELRIDNFRIYSHWLQKVGLGVICLFRPVPQNGDPVHLFCWPPDARNVTVDRNRSCPFPLRRWESVQKDQMFPIWKKAKILNEAISPGHLLATTRLLPARWLLCARYFARGWNSTVCLSLHWANKASMRCVKMQLTDRILLFWIQVLINENEEPKRRQNGLPSSE